MPALAPRNDVVTFHVLVGILGVDALRNAQRALMTLPLIGTEFLGFSKRTQRQVLLVTPCTVRQDVRNDARLLSHIIVQHEFLDISVQSVASVLDFP